MNALLQLNLFAIILIIISKKNSAKSNRSAVYYSYILMSQLIDEMNLLRESIPQEGLLNKLLRRYLANKVYELIVARSAISGFTIFTMSQ